MENQVSVVNAPVRNIDIVRETCVKGIAQSERKTGEIIKEYALALCQAYDILGQDGQVTTKWFDAKGKDAAPVKTERKTFAALMASAGFETPTIDVYWQRVKKASGKEYLQNRVKGQSDADSLNLANLRTLINRIFKTEEDGGDTAWSDVKGELIDVYTRMGGDADNLG